MAAATLPQGESGLSHHRSGTRHQDRKMVGCRTPKDATADPRPAYNPGHPGKLPQLGTLPDPLPGGTVTFYVLMFAYCAVTFVASTCTFSSVRFSGYAALKPLNVELPEDELTAF